MPLEHVGERGVDRLGERQALVRGGRLPASAATASGSRGASGRITSSARGELRPSMASSARSRMRFRVSRYSAASSSPVRVPPLDEPARRGRAAGRARSRSGSPCRRAVRGLEIGAGVAQEAHRPQVEHRRMAVLADPARRAPAPSRAVAAGSSPSGARRELRPPVERLLDPALGRRDADPEAVVLADEEQRERRAVVREVRRRVERRLRGRVVERRVAERAHDDRVERPGALRRRAPRALDREGDPHGARKVRGDRRRLRDDGEVGVAEDLVPPAGDRLLGGRRHAEEDVPDAVPPGLRRPREVEAARPVVEERRVGRLERERDERVRLVPGRADRVEAEPLRLEPPCRVVDRAALDAGPPGALRLAGGSSRVRAPAARAARRPGAARAGRGRRHGRGRYRVNHGREPPSGGYAPAPRGRRTRMRPVTSGSSRGPQRRRP